MIIVSQNNDHYYMASILFNCNVNVELTIACLTKHKLSNWKAKLTKLSNSSQNTSSKETLYSYKKEDEHL